MDAEDAAQLLQDPLTLGAVRELVDTHDER
jgi:hypothetical protein